MYPAPYPGTQHAGGGETGRQARMHAYTQISTPHMRLLAPKRPSLPLSIGDHSYHHREDKNPRASSELNCPHSFLLVNSGCHFFIPSPFSFSAPPAKIQGMQLSSHRQIAAAAAAAEKSVTHAWHWSNI